MEISGTTSLRYRENYFAEPALRAAFADLLAETFGIDLGPFDSLYGSDHATMPFSYFDETHRCVANLSAFPMQMLIGGTCVQGIGLQSGAVRPEWRRRGFYRFLLDRAVRWGEARGAELVLLYTARPVLYEAAGFRVIPEHSFVGEAPRRHAAPRSRRLSLKHPDDVSLLRRLLDDRSPVSRQIGLFDHGAMFLFNALNNPKITLDLIDHGAVVASEIAPDGLFRLVDVVGHHVPPLATILGALRIEPARVEVLFPPDRLSWMGTPRKIERAMALMVRGEIPWAMHAPFMLPPTASF